MMEFDIPQFLPENARGRAIGVLAAALLVPGLASCGSPNRGQDHHKGTEGTHLSIGAAFIHANQFETTTLGPTVSSGEPFVHANQAGTTTKPSHSK